MFASFRSDLRKLPLTKDAFNFHVLRALYQIAWYKRAHLSEPALPLPLEFGWRVQNKTQIPIRIHALQPNRTASSLCTASVKIRV